MSLRVAFDINDKINEKNKINKFKYIIVLSK